MAMPNANLAIVERRKIVEYLLNAAHPENGGKARFFVKTTETVHGKKFVMDASAEAPTGESRQIRLILLC